MTGVPAIEYHERTKHTGRSVRESDFRLDFDNKPIPYKIYEDLDAASLDEAPPPDAQALRAIGESAAPGRVPNDRDAVDRARRDRDADEGRVGRRALAQLCHYAAGVTKTIRRGDREIEFRAAACTGALYHVDLYVVCGDLPDLAAGVYHYDPRGEQLDVLREGDYRGALAGAAASERVRGAPATLVATSTWWRNAWKYRARTYRHAFWDSGTVLANLFAVARALDLPAELVAGFADEAVADLLGVDTAREAPVVAVPVGSGGGSEPAASADASPEIEPIDPETRPLSPNEKRYELIEAAHEASSLPGAEAVREWRGRAPAAAGDPGSRDPEAGLGTRDPGDGPRVDLDPVGDDRASKVPLGVAIERRGSCREYARETLNFRKVSTVLDRAIRGVPSDVRGDGAAPTFVDAYLIVHDVDGVAPGAYHYHPDAGELELLRDGEFRREAGHLALDQRLAADAGLCVYFLSDIGAVTDRLGDRGYRVAQLEAAVAAGRLYLGAYAHRDLGATGLTFYDDEVTDFLEPRAAGQTPMFLWTLGRPV